MPAAQSNKTQKCIEDSDEAWDEVWQEAVDVNVLAPARIMRHAVRHYLDSGGGTLITILVFMFIQDAVLGPSWRDFRLGVAPHSEGVAFGLAYSTRR